MCAASQPWSACMQVDAAKDDDMVQLRLPAGSGGAAAGLALVARRGGNGSDPPAVMFIGR